MEALIVIGILLVIGAVVFFVWRKKKSLNESQKWRFGTVSRALSALNSETPVRTSGNHEVYFEPGADRTGFSLEACDIGVEKTFEKSECSGYPVNRAQHHIKIVVFTGEDDSRGDPAFKVYIGMHSPYYNSEWDKRKGEGHNVDHYILAAGQTVASGTPYGDVIVVPAHRAGQEAHLATIVEYEMEHISLSYYDGEKADATQYHQAGTGHPLIPDCAGAARLASRPFRGLCASGEIVGHVDKN